MVTFGTPEQPMCLAHRRAFSAKETLQLLLPQLPLKETLPLFVPCPLMMKKWLYVVPHFSLRGTGFPPDFATGIRAEMAA